MLEDIEVFWFAFGVSGTLGQFVVLEHSLVWIVYLLLPLVEAIAD